MNELNNAIIKTLVYFDIFDYPLTLVEVWKWLYLPDCSYTLSEVQAAAESLTDKIETRNGFYFLRGKNWTVEQRLARYSLAEVKYRRAIKFVKLLRFIPFIKMIAVCNSLAYSNSGQMGDIDLFIVTQPNRLWLTRFLAVGFLKMLGVRPRQTSKRDAIDANFFLSEDHLNIESLQITSHVQHPASHDIYLAYWLDQLAPIFDLDGTYQKFQQANAWIKRILPNSFGCELNERRQVSLTPLSKFGRLIIKLLFDYDFKEKNLKKLQLKIMPEDLKKMMNQNTRVVVNQDVLKFHRDDRRQEYANKFRERLSTYEIN